MFFPLTKNNNKKQLLAYNFFDKTFITDLVISENDLPDLKNKSSLNSFKQLQYSAPNIKCANLLKQKNLFYTSFGKILRSASSIVGFKKTLNSRVKVRNMLLEPGYNRRKYSHTHYTQTKSQCQKLSKTYAYISSSKMKNILGFVLRNSYPTHKDLLLVSQLTDQVPKTLKSTQYFADQKLAHVPNQWKPLIGNQCNNSGLKSMENRSKLLGLLGDSSSGKVNRPVPFLVAILERQYDTILWRNQFCLTLRSARQWVNHHKNPGFADYGTVFFF